MNPYKNYFYFIFILSICFFSSYATQELVNKTSSQSNYFYSFLKVLEFFKDGSPSSNKMMNFNHYEASKSLDHTSSLIQTKDNPDNNNNATNCTGNASNSTENQTNETGLTAEDIQKVLHKENQALKKDILKSEDDIEKELVKASRDMEKKLDATELKIEDKIIKSSDILEKKIDHLESKVDENIQQTEEASVIIISQQIEEKQKDLEVIEKEINELKNVVNNEKELTDICHLYTSCSDCTLNPKCGWCIMENACVGGDNVGPKEDQCTFYTYHYCSTQSCARNTDCSSCLSDPNCGWCKDSSRSINICIEEQPTYQGCPSDEWFHSRGDKYECPKKSNTYDEINDEMEKQIEERKSMDTIKKLDKDELDMKRKRDELTEKQITAKSIKDEIEVLQDELTTLQLRLQAEKDKKVNIQNDEGTETSSIVKNDTTNINKSENENENEHQNITGSVAAVQNSENSGNEVVSEGSTQNSESTTPENGEITESTTTNNETAAVTTEVATTENITTETVTTEIQENTEAAATSSENKTENTVANAETPKTENAESSLEEIKSENTNSTITPTLLEKNMFLKAKLRKTKVEGKKIFGKMKKTIFQTKKQNKLLKSF